MLVLDEADRLLDLGFAEHLNAIMARLPKQRRTGQQSLTLNAAVSCQPVCADTVLALTCACGVGLHDAAARVSAAEVAAW